MTQQLILHLVVNWGVFTVYNRNACVQYSNNMSGLCCQTTKISLSNAGQPCYSIVVYKLGIYGEISTYRC